MLIALPSLAQLEIVQRVARQRLVVRARAAVDVEWPFICEIAVRDQSQHDYPQSFSVTARDQNRVVTPSTSRFFPAPRPYRCHTTRTVCPGSS